MSDISISENEIAERTEKKYKEMLNDNGSKTKYFNPTSDATMKINEREAYI